MREAQPEPCQALTIFRPRLLMRRCCPDRGLGAVLAHTFAAEGCNIAVNFQASEAVATELAKGIEEKYGVKTTAIQADVGATAECDRCVQDAIKALGGLDIVIGNAVCCLHFCWRKL